MKLLLAAFFSLSIIWQAQAQKQIDTQSQIFYRYAPTITLNSNWRIQSDAELRAFIDPVREHMIIIRGIASRKLNENWRLNLGLGYIRISNPQFPEQDVSIRVNEIRPSIGFQSSHTPADKFTLSNRYRFEFRFFDNNPGRVMTYQNLRIRYLIEGRYKLSDRFSPKIFNEVMINIGSKVTNNVFDQNRLGGGVNIAATNKITFEVAYLNWFQQRSSGNQFFNRHILRLAILQRF